MSHRLSSWREKEREREGEKGGKKEREGKKMEEIPVPGGKLQHHRPPTSNVSSGNKNKKAGESRCGGIDS